MNHLLVVATLVAVASAQEQCACAPQPVTIQLSCGGPQNLPELSPSPSPDPEVKPPADEEIGAEEWKIQTDPDRANCLWKNNGGGTYFLFGKLNTAIYWLSDFEGLHEWTHMNEPDPYDRIRWTSEDVPKPPRDWDGSASTLGYPMPEKHSDLYNALLCWPMFEEVPHEWNIKGDMDRRQCDFGSFKPSPYSKLPLPDGFNVLYTSPPELTEVHTPQDLPRPASDWDGRESTLGFPLPEKGTPFYNMLLCWPYDVRLKPQVPHSQGGDFAEFQEAG